jgi:hypothetical protein
LVIPSSVLLHDYFHIPCITQVQRFGLHIHIQLLIPAAKLNICIRSQVRLNAHDGFHYSKAHLCHHLFLIAILVDLHHIVAACFQLHFFVRKRKRIVRIGLLGIH